MIDLASYIREIPDFPKKGILFKDITPLLRDPAAIRRAVSDMEARHRADRIQAVAAVESRGFILGAALAVQLGAGFIPIRKPGKLPHTTLSERYELEYGTDTLEIHTDAVTRGERILLVDDLLATGGTAKAAASLIERMGGEVVGATFLVELAFLDGRSKMGSIPVHSLIRYA